MSTEFVPEIDRDVDLETGAGGPRDEGGQRTGPKPNSSGMGSNGDRYDGELCIPWILKSKG